MINEEGNMVDKWGGKRRGINPFLKKHPSRHTWGNSFLSPFQENPWMGEDLPPRLWALPSGNPAERSEAHREVQSVLFRLVVSP